MLLRNENTLTHTIIWLHIYISSSKRSKLCFCRRLFIIFHPNIKIPSFTRLLLNQHFDRHNHFGFITSNRHMFIHVGLFHMWTDFMSFNMNHVSCLSFNKVCWMWTMISCYWWMCFDVDLHQFARLHGSTQNLNDHKHFPWK